jgi:di/tricarboxylate transporter
MSWEAWLTCLTIVVLFLALVRNWAPADFVLVAALTVLVAAGELASTPRLPSATQAVAGLGNSGLVTVAILFVVVAGLVQTGAMSLIAGPLLGRPKTVGAAQARLMAPVVLLSAFLNNTPVVAMFMPVVEDICKRTRISPSKLYLPMAYAATFGGVCTLIGTSTNLIVNGLLIKAKVPGLEDGMRMFDLTWVGVPCAIAGIALMLVASSWLLPDRRAVITLHEDPRQYTVEMIVQEGGPLVGKTVEEAGLRHLPQLYLVEIERAGELLAAVSPRQRLHAQDRLVFVGVIESVVDLQKMRGLTRAAEPTFQLETPHTDRHLIEAVVSDRCPLIGTTIRDGQFRTTYNAAVVAVARAGRRIRGKVGDIVLRAGDTLLLEADEGFVPRERNSSHFFLISGVENSQPLRHDRAWMAIAILSGMVATFAAGWLDLLTAALLAAGLMIATQCCSITQARQSVDWSLLVLIAASLGIGQAIEMSGLAGTVSSQIIGLAGGHPWLVLVAVYFVTMVFTELITNNAAAVLVFPIAMASATTLGVNPMPFVLAVAIAASAGFATPFGYQTNLMVYSPGGYRFTDYLRFGIPLDIVFLVVTCAITPWVWPFR